MIETDYMRSQKKEDNEELYEGLPSALMYNNADPHKAAKSLPRHAIREREAFKQMFNELSSFSPVPTPDDFPIYAGENKVRNLRVHKESR